MSCMFILPVLSSLLLCNSYWHIHDRPLPPLKFSFIYSSLNLSLLNLFQQSDVYQCTNLIVFLGRYWVTWRHTRLTFLCFSLLAWYNCIDAIYALRRYCTSYIVSRARHINALCAPTESHSAVLLEETVVTWPIVIWNNQNRKSSTLLTELTAYDHLKKGKTFILTLQLDGV